MNLTETDQTKVSEWLGQFESEEDLNIYFYQGEFEIPWIFHAMATAKYKYIDINNVDGASKLLASYILGKNNTYYSTSDPDAKAVYSHINPNKVNGVIDFFERTLGAERQQS
jgi:hypothetical protein